MSDTDGIPPILVEQVGVEFPILNADMRSLQAQLVYLGSGGTLKREVGKRISVRALDGVSLRAEPGDRIGLIGRNGAGKTTLLRVLAGILRPEWGRVRVQGTISALLTGSLGVDEGVTGYQAIDYGGRLMGLDPKTVEELKPEIAEFTELGDYLAMPVRTYSSGMKVRLQFAIATCYRPDVLLVDEVIGAGDAHFVEKARERTFEFMRQASVMVLASHSNDIIHAICNKAILMEKGRILLAGEMGEVLKYYMETTQRPPRSVVPGRKATEGSCLSSEPASGTRAQDAFELGSPDSWRSVECGEEVEARAFLGVDLGPGNDTEIRQFELRQWSGADLPNLVRSLKMQVSDDGFEGDVRTIATIAVEPSIASLRYEVPPSGPARFWRLLANSPTGGGPWGVLELSFKTAAEIAQDTPTGGSSIASVHAGTHVASNLGDSSIDSMWVSIEAGDEIKGKSFVGNDFGPGCSIEVHRFLLRQWDGGARPNTVRSVKLQYSSDGFVSDIRDADVLEVAPDDQRHQYVCLPSERSRFWRLLANSATGGGHWGVVELEFSDQPEPKLGSDADAGWALGRPIADGDHASQLALHAFDGRSDTRWISSLPGDDTYRRSFIGYDFGSERRVSVRSLVIQQWNSGAPPNLIESVLVQCSDDGFRDDVREAAVVAIAANSMRNQYDLPDVGHAQFWRLLANGTSGAGGGPWGVVNLELWDEKGLRAGGRQRIASLA